MATHPPIPDWVWRMHPNLARYAVPFGFGRRPNRRLEPKLRGATCVAVDLGESPFLLTAHHVVQRALQVLSEPETECFVGPVELTIHAANVRSNADLDLATIPITREQVGTLEAELYQIVRPSQWPPPPLQLNDGVVLVGFPALWRVVRSWHEMDFRSTTLLLLIQQVREDEFVCQRDPAFMGEHTVGCEEVPPLDLPGMSGGPVFLIRQEPLVTWQLCGIIKQDLPLGEGNFVITCARLNALRRFGEIILRE